MASEVAKNVVDESSLLGVVVHLSGSRRGKSEPLPMTTLRVTASRGGGVRVVPPDETQDDEILATLHPHEESYEIVANEDKLLWVNGERVRNKTLASGDVVEFEDGVAIVRFRLYPHGSNLQKSVAQAFSDCVECARHDHRPPIGRAGGFFVDMLTAFATQTTLWFRFGVIVALAIVSVFLVLNALYTKDLEQRLADEKVRVEDLHALLKRTEEQALTRDDLSLLQAEMQAGISSTQERVQELEARSAAARRAIAQAAQAVVFIQGSFGFNDAETERPLRLMVGPDGQPIRMSSGRPAITLEGEGPPVEIIYTGSAFIVSEQGLLLTNRHVALPWENEAVYKEMMEKLGLVPVRGRFLGYLAGASEPFELSLVQASEDADIAVLSCEDIAGQRTPLRLRGDPPEPGDEVIVIGYPTGIRALLARAGNKFVDALRAGEDEPDAWQIAKALADAGLMAPLASRGIVGQVTADAIVYDAETTQGGSGGPVILMNGDVVAVNAAIFREFGGSNMGVPVAFAGALLNAD